MSDADHSAEPPRRADAELSGDRASTPAAGRPGGPRWLRWTGRVCALLIALELLLQVVRPDLLERVRELTFPVDKRDATFITLQRHNFDGDDHRPLLRLDQHLFWSLRPGQRGSWFGTDDVTINAAGLRSPEVGPRADDEVRLLFLGDSVTFGMGVAESERFSEQLLDELSRRRPGVRWSLINAGCLGYTSWQGVLWLGLHGEHLEVDGIVAGFGINDVILRPLSDQQFFELLQHPTSVLRLGLRELQLVAAAEVAVGLARRAFDDDPRALHTYLWYPRQATGRAPVRREANGLGPMAMLAGFSRAVPVTLLLEDTWPEHPSAAVLDDEYASRLATFGDRWRDTVRDLGADSSQPDALHLVDLRGTLSGDDDPAPLFNDWCHPSAAGHARYARTIADAWEASGVLDQLAAARGAR